jgi:hypothetical protein
MPDQNFARSLTSRKPPLVPSFPGNAHYDLSLPGDAHWHHPGDELPLLVRPAGFQPMGTLVIADMMSRGVGQSRVELHVHPSLVCMDSARCLTSGASYRPLVWMSSGSSLCAYSGASENVRRGCSILPVSLKGFRFPTVHRGSFKLLHRCGPSAPLPITRDLCTFLYLRADDSCRCWREAPKFSSSWTNSRTCEGHLQTQLPLVNPSSPLNFHQRGALLSPPNRSLYPEVHHLNVPNGPPAYFYIRLRSITGYLFVRATDMDGNKW